MNGQAQLARQNWAFDIPLRSSTPLSLKIKIASHHDVKAYVALYRQHGRTDVPEFPTTASADALQACLSKELHTARYEPGLPSHQRQWNTGAIFSGSETSGKVFRHLVFLLKCHA